LSSNIAESSNIVKGKKNNVPVPGLKNGMDYIPLGDSTLMVSKVCMGTMTFGQQNTLEQGVEQLNEAFDVYGVNFLDTSEIYPVPTKADTQGKTDKIIAVFLAGRNRADVVLATKVAGPGVTWLPRREKDTPSSLTREQIIDSVDASLERLGTDYIDLLQLHWPDRYTGSLFGTPDFTPSVYEQRHPTEKPPVEFDVQLAACQELIDAGKVRYIGVSNETPFGVCSMGMLAKLYPKLYPKIVSIQNSYSLVCRKDFESGIAEACYHYNVGLLPYSPLAGGSLTGKYRNGPVDGEARLNMFPGYMERYLGSLNEAAVNAYCDLAKEADMTPSQLALSWIYHNELVASTIIGATTMEQLRENLKAYDLKLDDDVQEKISQIYKQYTDPTKAKNR
jgi:aryl-alcohol dehydrogenase-like predicted oxidoreductase